VSYPNELQINDQEIKDGYCEEVPEVSERTDQRAF
jgi:hypothetical protein